MSASASGETGAASARRWRAEAALIVVTFIWGATFVTVKGALDAASTMLFLSLRFTLAAIVLGLLFRGRIRWRQASGGLIAGVFLICGYAFQTCGLRYTTPSKSAFLTGLTTVATPLLAAAVFRRAPHWVEMAGVALATLGMGMLTMTGERWSLGFGETITLGCAVCYAAHILALARFSPRTNFETIGFVQIATGAALAWCATPLIERPFIRPSFELAMAVAVTGVLATALGFSVQSWAQQNTTATRTALIFALEPVFAWMTAYVLTGETLTGRAAAGSIFILAGVLTVELKPFRTVQHPFT